MEDNKQQSMAVHHQSIITHSGPLPPAAEFAQYEQAYPGTAAKVLDMAENEANQRHAREMKKIDDKVKAGRRGQYCAFTIAMTSLAVVTVCAIIDRPLATIVPAIIACTSLAAVFLKR